MEKYSLDVNKKFNLDDLAKRLQPEYQSIFKKKFQASIDKNKKIRVYADGCFDMFHFGHSRLFKQIKDLHPNIYLIVGVCSDADMVSHKGTFVMGEKERCESVIHCKWVDELHFPAPWVPTIEFMKEKNFEYIAHDTIPYSNPENDDCYYPMKKAGLFLPTLRTEGVSTSDLLTRILKDRDQYYKKILKKGVSRDKVNLNYLEYLFIQMKGVMNTVETCLKSDPSGTKKNE